MCYDVRLKEERNREKKENADMLPLGTKVTHTTFGRGEIVGVEWENGRVLVDFEDAGKKKLSTLDIFRYIEIVE